MSAACAARMASLPEKLAAVVAAVGEDDHGATAYLVAEFDFGDGADGVEEERSAAARGTDVVVGLREVGEAMLEGGGVGGELDELEDARVELDQDGAVRGPGEHGGKEDAAGDDFVGDVGALAAAGVDHEGKSEGEVGALREVGDGLGFAVLFQQEVGAGEAGDGLAGGVADDGGDGDEIGLDLEGRRDVRSERGGLFRRRGWGCGRGLGEARRREQGEEEHAGDGDRIRWRHLCSLRSGWEGYPLPPAFDSKIFSRERLRLELDIRLIRIDISIDVNRWKQAV